MVGSLGRRSLVWQKTGTWWGRRWGQVGHWPLAGSSQHEGGLSPPAPRLPSSPLPALVPPAALLKGLLSSSCPPGHIFLPGPPGPRCGPALGRCPVAASALSPGPCLVGVAIPFQAASPFACTHTMLGLRLPGPGGGLWELGWILSTTCTHMYMHEQTHTSMHLVPSQVLKLETEGLAAA